jgi:hypothetical protein
MKRAITLLVLSLLPLRVMASGHGPIFGLATPTNSQGEWSFDQGVFGRSTSVGSQASIRELLGYGFTPHLTLSFTLPVVVGDTRLPPTRIQPGDDFDSTLAWRFQHRATKVGTRIESTAFAGLVVPGPQSAFNGVANTSNVPGFMVGAVTGRASLSHYVWLGATFTKFGDHDGNQRPDVFDYSFVYGYRPPKWRRTPDKWDWRLFGELVGEHSNKFQQANAAVANTKRTKSFSALQPLESIATTRSALVLSSRFIGTWVPYGRRSVCVSPSISVICYSSTHTRR